MQRPHTSPRKGLLLIAASLAVAAATGLPAAAPNKTRGEPGTATTQHWLNDLYPHGKRARDIVGMPVLGASGQRLGSVSDLLVDTGSGRVVYAIVSSSGMIGLGSTRHAVPFSALGYANDYRDSLRLDVSDTDWAKAPVFSDEQIPALADQARADYVYRYYHQTWEPLDAGNPVRTDQVPGGDGGLRAASRLFGRDVQAGGRTVGTVDDLIVDVDARNAAVLLNPDDQFSGTSADYVVPFRQLSAVPGGSDALATTLTRSDLESARPFGDAAAGEKPTTIYRWEVAPRH